MSSYQHFRETASRQKKRQNASPTQVNGISGIPFETTPEERFRLTVDVERVCEQETKDGAPCYFLACRDAEGMTFSVVVWDSQWSRIQGQVEKGSKLAIDVRVPKEGYSAFTMA